MPFAVWGSHRTVRFLPPGEAQNRAMISIPPPRVAEGGVRLPFFPERAAHVARQHPAHGCNTRVGVVGGVGRSSNQRILRPEPLTCVATTAVEVITRGPSSFLSGAD